MACWWAKWRTYRSPQTQKEITLSICPFPKERKRPIIENYLLNRSFWAMEKLLPKTLVWPKGFSIGSKIYSNIEPLLYEQKGIKNNIVSLLLGMDCLVPFSPMTWPKRGKM